MRKVASHSGTKVIFRGKQLQSFTIRDRTGINSATRLVPMMREYTVFNVDQCENLPDSIYTVKPMRVTANPDMRDEFADTFLHLTRADIPGVEGQ